MTYDDELISFFKRHKLYNKEMFDYFSKNTTMIDYKDEEQRDYVRTIFVLDKNNVLKRIKLYLPYIYDEITMLISIHELVHAIQLYKKLNKKITITDDYEVLPLLYEKIYTEETNNENLRIYGDNINKYISDKDKPYVIGLTIRDELYKKYNYNINKMKRLSKKLIRKIDLEEK